MEKRKVQAIVEMLVDIKEDKYDEPINQNEEVIIAKNEEQLNIEEHSAPASNNIEDYIKK